MFDNDQADTSAALLHSLRRCRHFLHPPDRHGNGIHSHCNNVVEKHQDQQRDECCRVGLVINLLMGHYYYFVNPGMIMSVYFPYSSESKLMEREMQALSASKSVSYDKINLLTCTPICLLIPRSFRC